MAQFIVDMARRFKTGSLGASQLGYRQLMPKESEDNLCSICANVLPPGCVGTNVLLCRH